MLQELLMFIRMQHCFILIISAVKSEKGAAIWRPRSVPLVCCTNSYIKAIGTVKVCHALTTPRAFH